VNRTHFPVSLRPMRPEDLDKVMTIAASLPEAPHWPRSAYEKVLDPEATPPRIALVAHDGATGSIVGFALACVAPPEAELESIVTASPFQRKGIACQLFTLLSDELRQRAVSELNLEVRASNEAALLFYKSLGFAEVGRRIRYYADPVEDAILMRLLLSSQGS
jgi:[ribosomal protein S18]-alanine N-acetyltransferase